MSAALAMGVLTAGAVALAGCQVVESPVTDSASAPSDVDARGIARALVDFADAPGVETFAAVGLADEVWLGLADRLIVLRQAPDLVNAEAWLVDPGAAGFRERTGPLSALDLLAAGDQTVLSSASHSNCFGEERPPPDRFADFDRISITPDRNTIALCMNWWSVDLYITDAAEIAGVTLDLGDP